MTGLTRMTFMDKSTDYHKKEPVAPDSEQQFINFPMKPHFFFNIMNSIYHSITLNPVQAETILLQLSEMMQFNIYECSKEKVQLENEIRNIQNYIALNNMRLSHQPEIHVEVNGDTQGQFIAPHILMTFVENAYQHGLTTQRDHSFLDINFFIHKNELQFSAVNSRAVTPPGHRIPAGRGLSKVKKRLESLYPLHHKLSIEESPAEYKVRLDMKLAG